MPLAYMPQLYCATCFVLLVSIIVTAHIKARHKQKELVGYIHCEHKMGVIPKFALALQNSLQWQQH